VVPDYVTALQKSPVFFIATTSTVLRNKSILFSPDTRLMRADCSRDKGISHQVNTILHNFKNQNIITPFSS